MNPKFSISLASLVVFFSAASIQAQTAESALTAREMFLAARDNKSSVKATPRVTKKPVRPEPVETAETNAAPRPSGNSSVSRPSRDNGTALISAAYSTSPLGLRYTIMKREGSRSVDVPTDTVFHTGDRIHLAVEVTEPGFLYIVTRGSSGTWEMLFPSPKIEHGDNRVGPQGRYVVPQGYEFAFSGKPDTEKLFVVFSRQHQPEIDTLIYSLQNNKAQPAGEPTPVKHSSEPLIMASTKPIDDSVVSMLRQTYSRDLIIEPVNENGDSKQPGHPAEHSVYVVNPKGGGDSRVVADISLTHQ